MLIVTMLLTALPLAAHAESSKYSDIPDGQWFTQAVTAYGYSDIFSDGSGKFYPNKKIARIEFARLLHHALGITINYFAAPDISDDFDDMKNTDTGASELIDLVTTGVVESGGNFNPNGQLDREVMIHWIKSALDYKTGGNYAIIKIMPAPFNDDKDITPAYKDDVVVSVILKLVFGRGDNMLFPKDGATRAEAATMVSRLISLLDTFKSDVDITSSAILDKNGTLTMSLTIQNNTDKKITMNHTSGQKYDFKLFDDKGNNVYTWSADKMFIAALTSTELKPGENIVFSDTLDSASNTSVASAATMTAYIVGTSNDFVIDENGYPATIVK